MSQPRKKSKSRSQRRMTTSHGDNPFLPFLLTMHERWTPEQIAACITQLDETLMSLDQNGTADYTVSQTMVMVLSKLPQRTAQTDAVKRELGRVQDTGANLGKCSKCHVKETILLVEEPPGSGKVKGYCGSCAPPEPEEERVTAEAGS